MAKDCSFDVVSEFDKQELVNAVDQVKRDLASRFDLKNSNSTIDLEAPTIPVPNTNSTSYLIYGIGALIVIAGIVLIVVAKRPNNAKEK